MAMVLHDGQWPVLPCVVSLYKVEPASRSHRDTAVALFPPRLPVPLLAASQPSPTYSGGVDAKAGVRELPILAPTSNPGLHLAAQFDGPAVSGQLDGQQPRQARLWSVPQLVPTPSIESFTRL